MIFTLYFFPKISNFSIFSCFVFTMVGYTSPLPKPIASVLFSAVTKPKNKNNISAVSSRLQKINFIDILNLITKFPCANQNL